jgi:hypothetical protein
MSNGKGIIRMFACFCLPKVAPLIPYPSVSAEPYQGAGILFIEGPVALAGIQKHRQVLKGSVEPRLSGFGGRREDQDIDWVHTAFRETVEELRVPRSAPEVQGPLSHLVQDGRILDPSVHL